MSMMNGKVHYGFGYACGGSPPACGGFFLSYERSRDWRDVTCKNCLRVKKSMKNKKKN